MRSKRLVRIISAGDLIAMVESLDLDQLVDLAQFTSGSTGDETYQIGASKWMEENGIVLASDAEIRAATRTGREQ